MSRPSCFTCLAGMAVLCLFAGVPADAVVLVVRPDGSGDVPTFQAGLNSLTSVGALDTLLVEAGDYAEDIVLPPHEVEGFVICPVGPQRTSVRSIFLINEPLIGVTIQGLSVEQSLGEPVPRRVLGIDSGPKALTRGSPPLPAVS